MLKQVISANSSESSDFYGCFQISEMCVYVHELLHRTF